MKRIVTLTLALVLMVSMFAFPASAAQTLDILDPGKLLGVKGNVYESRVPNSYDMHMYDFFGKQDDVENFLKKYEEEMDKTAFTRIVSESDTEEYNVFYYHQDELVMIMSVDMDEDLSREYGKGAARWSLLLMVADGYNVTRYPK